MALLSGSLVVLELECRRVSLTDSIRQVCISLRVAGISGKILVSLQKNLEPSGK